MAERRKRSAEPNKSNPQKRVRGNHPDNVFEKKLRLAIAFKDTNQARLAEELGVTTSVINEKIKRNNFTEDVMRKYADMLGFDVEIKLIDRETGTTF